MTWPAARVSTFGAPALQAYPIEYSRTLARRQYERALRSASFAQKGLITPVMMEQRRAMVESRELDVKEEVAKARSVNHIVSMGFSSHANSAGNTAKERTIRLTHKGRILTEGDRKRPKGKIDPERPDQLLGGVDLTKGGYLGDSRGDRFMDGRNVASGVTLNRKVMP